MHMTLEADYAVRIVERLSESEGRLDAHTISEDTQVPLRFSLKILRKLVAEELVKSYKEPGLITLRQVIEAVEGPYVLNRCLTKEYNCCHTECRFHQIYDEVSSLVRDRLDQVTFDREKKPDR